MAKKQKTKSVGAPRKVLTFPRGKFTQKEMEAVNEGVCSLTVRNGILREVKSGVITLLPEKQRVKGQVGKPSNVFIRTAVLNGYKSRLAETPISTEVETPVMSEVPVESVGEPTPEVVVVETPVEAPAELVSAESVPVAS